MSDALAAFRFMLSDGCGDSLDVEVVCPADLFPKVKVLDDEVAALHMTLPDGNSSGVQIIGGCKFEERQVASIVLRMAAFARCLQFHVSR